MRLLALQAAAARWGQLQAATSSPACSLPQLLLAGCCLLTLNTPTPTPFPPRRAALGRGARWARPARDRRPHRDQDVQRGRRLRDRAGHAVRRERAAQLERVHQPRGGQQPVHRCHHGRPRPQRGPPGDEEPHLLPVKRHHPRGRCAAPRALLGVATCLPCFASRQPPAACCRTAAALPLPEYSRTCA